jgi:hypothetical protein
LTSASDCLSLKLCGRIIPEDWLNAMLLLRSPVTEIRLGGKVWTEDLNMMSTMGNGFTFPLQTVIFACAAAACVSLSDDIRSRPLAWSSWRPGGLFSTFGDDLAIIAKCGPRLARFLELIGFMPNEDKCFYSGAFRESCGHDYYNGYNVRPVFVRKASTVQDLTVLFNLFVEWATRLNIQIDATLAVILRALIKSGGTHLVPLEENMDAGLKLPLSVIRLCGITKCDPWVQAIRYSAWRPSPNKIRFGEARKNWKSDPLVLHAQNHRVVYNPSGLYIAMLRGECRGGSISVRNGENTRYATKQLVSSRWDWRAPVEIECRTGHSLSFADYACRSARLIAPNAFLIRRAIRVRTKRRK